MRISAPTPIHILDRLVHNAHGIALLGESLRKKCTLADGAAVPA